ncbi:MAG: ABC transporter permease [Candidatus Omnitrophica bacterium]|nr:ABC transporter permease [Candidatus Omnitrophota bacterium]
MIELKNVTMTYRMGDTDVKAMAGVSLKISAGEFVAIMGPSGSGKSTMMHILGLLDRPTSGEYTLGTKKINNLSDDELAAIRNKLAGFVFQQFHLLPRMTALGNAELPLIYAGKRHLRSEAEKRLVEVGLGARMNHRPNELSGGQQQRVAIARALVNDPLIIFADEPTGNLDSKSKEEILSILEGLHQKGKTIVMVTHEPEIAAHAGRIIRMVDGKIVSDEMNKERTGVKPTVPAASDADKIINDVLSKEERKAREAKFFDYLGQAVSAMISHKMRSFLSILGILIGVAAVIAMLAIGEGAKSSIEKQLASLGSNLLVIRPGSSKVHGVSLETGSVANFTFQDITAIAKIGGDVKRVSPSVTGRGQLVYASKNWNTQVEGVDVEYADMRASQPVAGRFFTADEIKRRDKVAILGLTVVKELFGDSNPIGETMKINLINFKVIGILPEKGANTFRDQDDTLLIPVTTAMYRVFGKEYLDSIYVEAASTEVLDTLQDEISKIIIKQHRISKDKADDAFQIRNMSDMKQAMESTTKTMSLLLGAISAISLLVGGIGIMNIMLVSVTERTREIGLRKAIGASNKDVLVQFLIEAVAMSSIGGLVGIAIGSGISILITLMAGWTVKISLFSILLSTVFSIMVGVVFGLWPAKQASMLNPIEALRYE